MSTNNFTFQNMCVVVHEDNYDNTDSDFFQYWGDCLINKVVCFERYTKRTWNQQEALIIGEVPFYRGNGELYATIYVTYKSGYYAGACLDYVTEYNEDGENDKKIKRLELAITYRENTIKRVLRSFGEEYMKVGQFSNGEAVYQKRAVKAVKDIKNICK